MPKRSRKPSDLNSLAAAIVSEATALEPELKASFKDPIAVELGRRGGLKGGKARAELLTPDERKKIAQDAAKARWSKKGTS